MSVRRLLGAHLPEVFPERREKVAGECLGCRTRFAVDVRLPLPATCPDCGDRRARPGGHRGSGRAGPAAVQRAAGPEDEAVTLRFIVARIMREA